MAATVAPPEETTKGLEAASEQPQEIEGKQSTKRLLALIGGVALIGAVIVTACYLGFGALWRFCKVTIREPPSAGTPAAVEVNPSYTQAESLREVENFAERDVVSFPSASESGLVEIKNIPSGTYKLRKLRRMTYHISKEIGFRACFTHTLVVPGGFDNLDKTYKSVDWGSIDLSRGWITSFAAHIPMTIVSAGGVVSFPVQDYYFQQIIRSREQKDGWSWGFGQERTFRGWSQVTEVFDPKNEEPGSKLYKMTGSREKDGFNSAQGRIKVADGILTLFDEFEWDNYVNVVALEYNQ
jgi:hypothetical protein